MARHPGDPRSDAHGNIPFDPAEGIHHYVPPAMPPQNGNVDDFVPFLGQNNHGVQNPRSPEHGGYESAEHLPFLSDQLAQNLYTDPRVTPRDIEPAKPIPVTVVDRPDLLRRRNTYTTSYTFTDASPLDWMQLCGPSPFRERVVITATVFAGYTYVVGRLSTANDSPDDLQSIMFRTTTAQTITVLDSECTNAVWFKPSILSPSGASNLLSIGVMQEFSQSDGDPLL